MSEKEVNRIELIVKLTEKKISRSEICALLNLSYRQVSNLLRSYREKGFLGLVNGNRGRESNRKYPEAFQLKVINIVRDKYYDFGPTFAREKLNEEDGIRVSRETLRKWMIDAGLWLVRKKRKKQKPREWRKRKENFGQMIQLDGSEEFWFESRGPKCVLMSYIDDATNLLFARFYESESTYSAMDSLKNYIQEYGIPSSIYFDRHSVYKTTRNANLDEQLKGDSPLTQFGRVMELLKIKRIYAYSPQAKGRIENKFKTLQDRLIKELRLANVDNMHDGNKFLESYLIKFNERFSFPAVSLKNYHKKVPTDLDLDWIFSIEETRVIARDHTVRWQNRLFLIREKNQYLKGKIVTIKENLMGVVRIIFGQHELDYKEITKESLYNIRKKTQNKTKPCTVSTRI